MNHIASFFHALCTTFIKKRGSHCQHATHTLQSALQIMDVNDGLTIPNRHYQTMLHHLQATYPLEGCGLMSGKAGTVTAVYPIDNILKSPTAYEMDPKQQAETMLAIEANGDDLLAIYHSHPVGPLKPSPTDIDRAYYPESIYLIVSLASQDRPKMKGYWIVDTAVFEIKVRVS